MTNDDIAWYVGYLENLKIHNPALALNSNGAMQIWLHHYNPRIVFNIERMAETRKDCIAIAEDYLKARSKYQEEKLDEEGVKLRDKFAMAALTGLLAANKPDHDIATSAYIIADDMIKARRPKC